MKSSTVDVLLCGTGEYTTGCVNGEAAKSDKGTGVTGLTCLDLRRRGKVNRIGMVGRNGKKLPGIRAHMKRKLGDVYDGIHPEVIECWPADDKIDDLAYETAADSFRAGDCAIVFTPDDTHFDIALACIERGMHVMVTKPVVKTLQEHLKLIEAATKKGVLVGIDFHKRFDPIYTDARDKIQALGPFSYYSAYMSQPKHQLETFKEWAGKSSDISYYLNSHHVDILDWATAGKARCESVTGLGSNGVATKRLNGVKTEDTITLATQWRNLSDGSMCHAVFTSSWIAPPSDVHSQSRFHYMGQSGEVNVDQCHRGYTTSNDAAGQQSSVNPLFWKPTPTGRRFTAQRCYGYISIESFLEAAAEINSGVQKAQYFDAILPTIGTTVMTTAILEAGRRSLDAGGKPMAIVYSDDASYMPMDIRST